MPLSDSDIDMRVPQLVVCDCDGVLVDSETISNVVLARTLSELGLPTTPAQARRDYQGLLLPDIGTRAAAKLGRPLPDDWSERFERDRAVAFRSELKPVAGAAEAVRRIKAAGVPVCVASQGKLEKTRMTLGLTGMRGMFADEALFSAWTVPRGKPHPDLFLHAAASMGAEPADCAVVEDSPSGITAAVAAGMRAIGYTGDSDEGALRAAGAETTLSSLEQLPALLGVA
jgi:beta-phosphoglucomutase-like phosphatase (HAD superfamily)